MNSIKRIAISIISAPWHFCDITFKIVSWLVLVGALNAVAKRANDTEFTQFVFSLRILLAFSVFYIPIYVLAKYREIAYEVIEDSEFGYLIIVTFLIIGLILGYFAWSIWMPTISGWMKLVFDNVEKFQ
tara:strand:- start:3898 stop:4284 length:387 start_codon:yes stop_codon:yes gene_type:complete